MHIVCLGFQPGYPGVWIGVIYHQQDNHVTCLWNLCQPLNCRKNKGNPLFFIVRARLSLVAYIKSIAFCLWSARDCFYLKGRGEANISFRVNLTITLIWQLSRYSWKEYLQDLPVSLRTDPNTVDSPIWIIFRCVYLD